MHVSRRDAETQRLVSRLDHALDSAGPQDGDVEVDEEPDLEAGCPQVASNLSEMDWEDGLQGFQFDDQLSLNQEIDPPLPHALAFVANLQDRLAHEGNTTRSRSS